MRGNLIEDLEPPFLDLHAAVWTGRNEYKIVPTAKRFENWETNYAAKIRLDVAVEYALSWGLEAIWERVKDLACELRLLLSELPGVTVQDLGAEQCGIVTFSVDGVDSHTVQRRLAERKINVSVSVQEYARLDMDERRLPNVVRASVHYYNTREELLALCNGLIAR